MTQTITITTTPDAADAVFAALSFARHGDSFRTGELDRTRVEITDETIEISGGNKAERAAAARRVREIASNTAAPTKAEPADADVATPKQIAYLTRLIHNDPGLATTFGASRDGVRPVDGLTKARASHLIDQLRVGA